MFINLMQTCPSVRNGGFMERLDQHDVSFNGSMNESGALLSISSGHKNNEAMQLMPTYAATLDMSLCHFRV
jgi:hypothetical protein